MAGSDIRLREVIGAAGAALATSVEGMYVAGWLASAVFILSAAKVSKPLRIIHPGRLIEAQLNSTKPAHAPKICLTKP